MVQTAGQNFHESYLQRRKEPGKKKKKPSTRSYFSSTEISFFENFFFLFFPLPPSPKTEKTLLWSERTGEGLVKELVSLPLSFPAPPPPSHFL